MSVKRCLGLGILTILPLLATPAHARDPADVFAGKVILSTKPFPASFKSDRAFVRFMKKANQKSVYYPKSNYLNLEFMGFFGRTYAATEYTCLVYNVTDRNKLVRSFPIYPESRENRILASGFRISRDVFPEEKTYRLIVSLNGRALAETVFSIKENAENRRARLAKEKALKDQKINF
ncbi:MAG: hypothetical protein VX589_17400 [Myxococcota bacterium]|nr:hypothetical protein [Myxococcota bacterium]